jgi:hypothetical protein
MCVCVCVCVCVCGLCSVFGAPIRTDIVHKVVTWQVRRGDLGWSGTSRSHLCWLGLTPHDVMSALTHI